VEKFERDVSEWRGRSSLDLHSLVDEELKCLKGQMQKAHLEAQEAARRYL